MLEEAQEKKLTLFFCYAPEDQDLLEKLKKQLVGLRRQGLIDEWFDRTLLAGTVWRQEADQQLSAAQIILLLISPDFLASDDCYSVEMQRAMERHSAGTAHVIPIILRPADWQAAPFSKLQVLPRDAKPIVGWRNRDEAFANVAQGIREVIEQWQGERAVREIELDHNAWEQQTNKPVDPAQSKASNIFIPSKTSNISAAASASQPPAPTRSLQFVTNREYLKFVQIAGNHRPRHWNPDEPPFPDDQGDAPVTGIAWVDAVAYCDWVGGCLPATDAGDAASLDIPDIGEWRDAGTEWQKQVCDPHTSRLIEAVHRETPRQHVGFRCTPVRPVPPPKWVFIEGGACSIGTDVTKFRSLADSHILSSALSQPILRRLVKIYPVRDFHIAATCVTNEEYYQFTQARGWNWPSHWKAKWLGRSKRPFPARLAAQPVVNVSAEDAQLYCIWSRTRLPTWIEWERAASGPTRQPYPWGTDYSAARCNSKESGRGSLAAVDDYAAGDSPEGVRQFCGNVAEWVEGPEKQFEIRGGGYLMSCELWGLVYAFRKVQSGSPAPDVGFRVVK